MVELLDAVGDARGSLGQTEVGAQAPLRPGGDARDLGAAEVEGHAVRLAVGERRAEAFSGCERSSRILPGRGNHTHGRLRDRIQPVPRDPEDTMTTTRREILKAIPAAAVVAAAGAVPARRNPALRAQREAPPAPRPRRLLDARPPHGQAPARHGLPRLHRQGRAVGGGRGRADVLLLPDRLHAGLRGRAQAPLPPARPRRLDDAHPQHLHLPRGAGAGEGDRARQALARRGRGPRLPRHPHLRGRRAEGPAGGGGPAELRRVDRGLRRPRREARGLPRPREPRRGGGRARRPPRDREGREVRLVRSQPRHRQLPRRRSVRRPRPHRAVRGHGAGQGGDAGERRSRSRRPTSAGSSGC